MKSRSRRMVFGLREDSSSSSAALSRDLNVEDRDENKMPRQTNNVVIFPNNILKPRDENTQQWKTLRLNTTAANMSSMINSSAACTPLSMASVIQTHAVDSLAYRQKQLSGELGGDVTNVYRERLEMEKKFARPDYQVFDGSKTTPENTAKMIERREHYIEAIYNTSIDFKLSHSTTGVAVKYFDRVITVIKLTPNQTALLAIVCIVLAAHVEQTKGPSLEDLLYDDRWSLHDVYTLQDAKDMMTDILSGLDYRLWTITPGHHLDYYLAAGVFCDSDRLKCPRTGAMEILDYHRKKVVSWCHYFSYVSLMEIEFQRNHTALQASAIVAISRKSVGFYPIWPARLEKLTGYSCHANSDLEILHLRLHEVFVKKYALGDAGVDENEAVFTPLGAFSTTSPLGIMDLVMDGTAFAACKQ